MNSDTTGTSKFDIAQALREHAAQVQSAFEDAAAYRLGEGQRLTLSEFYFNVFLPEQGRLRGVGIHPDTLGKERTAINRWLHYSRPERWPEGQDWPGLPLSLMTASYVQSVLEKMKSDLADGTAKSTWNHLRGLLHFAAKMGFIVRAPSIEPSMFDVKPERILNDREIETVYLALKDHYELQVAWILALTTGLRTLELFLLEWELAEIYGDRPRLGVRPRSADCPDSVPLPEVAVRHLVNLANLQGPQELLFPGWSSPESVDPEKAKRARARRGVIQKAMRLSGIDAPRPFQAAKATYKHRLKRFRKQITKNVLEIKGSGAGWDDLIPSDLTYSVLNAIPWPAPFYELPSTLGTARPSRNAHGSENT